jgi:hypothetical protein
MKRTSVHLREGQTKAISEMRKESIGSEEYPELSESEIIRRLVDSGLKHSGLSDLVGEATQIRHKRERYKENQGWINNMRGGFRARIAQEFKQRFKAGWSPEELRKFEENMVQDAYILWPGREHEQAREDKIRYVEEVAETTILAVETSDMNPLDPETLYDQFTGVEEGEKRETVETTRESETFEQVVEDALERIDATVTTRSDAALCDALSNIHNVEQTVAEEAIEEARERAAYPGGVEA